MFLSWMPFNMYVENFTSFIRLCWSFNSNSFYAPLSQYLLLCHTTYHGLWTPNEAFFYRNPKLLGLGRQIGQINLGAFGVFLPDLSAPILVH